MSKRNLRLIMGVLMISAMLVSSFALVGAQDGSSITVSIMGQNDIPTLDPSLAEDVSGIQGIDMLFPGLTILDETTVELQPGIASSWDISDDGLTYTFNLIPDISWVRYDEDAGEVVQVTDAEGNVRTVTAQDVVYGWTRSLTPDTSSYYASVLAPWVEGAAGFLETGEGDIAIAALDDNTFQVTTTADFAFLPNIFGMWMGVPQPEWVIEEHGDFWTEPENIATYGPYALKEWAHDESVTFTKNPFWAGIDAMPEAQIEEVTNVFLEQSAALDSYEAGELVYINPVSLDALERVQVEYPDEFGVGPGTCTYYYGFNTEKAPFDNVHARRAFSLGIDRDAVTENVLKAGQVPAAFFTRPDMVAAPQQADYEEVALLVTEDDDARIAAAQEEWQAYLDETGISADDLPPITLMFNESEAHASIAEAIQNMWLETLGVEVDLASQEWATYLETRANDAPQIFRVAWCYDYPDAHNWTFDVLRSDSGQADDGGNEINWVNEEFDALLIDAASSPDVAERENLYGQAEVILNWTDAVIAPIYYYTTTLMLSPDVEAPFSNTGVESFEKWTLR